MNEVDIAALGELYFASYDPGVACDTLDEATADVEVTFMGDYGELWLDASPLIEHDGEVVAAVMTVRRAPWDDAGDCPFIVELFTDRQHRRRGLGRWLVRSAMNTAATNGENMIQLRVATDNAPALQLYAALGFR